MLQLLVKPIPVFCCLNCPEAEPQALEEGQQAFTCPSCGTVLMERLTEEPSDGP